MEEPRSVLPTDLLALVSYAGRSYRNEAWTRERVGAEESQNTLGMVLDQFLAFARGRSAWISVRRQRLQGLVGARRRGGRQAWEIDYLIDATPRHEVVSGLLDCAIGEVGRGGAEKLFLRLATDSELLPVIREAGFIPYQEEVLYARAGRPDAETPDMGLRTVAPSDAYLLYRFYNLTTPESTRRSEAATYNEWHAAQERHWLGKNAVQLVQEEKGEVLAWAKAARLHQGVALELMVGEGAMAQTQDVVEAAIKAVEPNGAPVFTLIPRTAESLARRVEAAGFEPRDEFVCLMRRTTRPQALPKLVPAIAKNAVGA